MAPQALLSHVDPASAPQQRLMAAKNLVPMRPAEMLTVLALLCFDPDQKISESAANSIKELPESMLGQGLSEKLDPVVLDFYGRFLVSDEAQITRILRNHATDDRTFAWLAGECKGRNLEIIADNQIRFLRHHDIIARLYHNPLTLMSTVDRVVEMAVRSGIIIESIPAFEAIAAEIRGQPETDASSEDELSEKTRFDGLDDQEYLQLLIKFGAIAAAPEKKQFSRVEADKEAEAPEDERFVDLMSKVNSMNLSQKIRLAMVGDKAARSLLIRSPMKTVSVSVLRNPRVTEQEIFMFSQNKSMSEDCIRVICNNRDWTRNYQVCHALACNPKTPTRLAMRFLSNLFENDLRSISKNRNLPNAIQRHAKKTLEVKRKRRGG